MRASKAGGARFWVDLSARWLVGFVFLYAGLVKLSDPQAFALQIAAYRLTPDVVTNVLAATLPVLEILCGLLLITRRWVLGASAVAVALLLMFLFAMTSALARGLDIDCGCFSVSGGHSISVWRLIEDAGLLVAAITAYALAAGENRRPSSAH